MSASDQSPRPADRDSLSVELGSWFRANATGRGVLAIPVLVALLVGAALAKTLVG